MNLHRTAFLLLATAAVLGPLALGCGGKDSTAPPVTVTGPQFDFSFPGAGTSHQFMFTQAGDWGYRCKPHAASGMTGTIFVRESSSVATATVTVAPGGAFVFSPDTVTIAVNGTITWVNPTSATIHTVTRP